MNDGTLTIGQLAKRAGLNLSAIRYYEAKGLLPEAPRVSGQRRFTEETLARLRVIDVAKRAGFTLDDIRILLDASDAGEPAHESLRELALRKLPEVDELIARAERVRGWLATAAGCGCDTLDVCALFSPEAALDGFGGRRARDVGHARNAEGERRVATGRPRSQASPR
ncbi:MAG TPA: MerR family transcriptional regulator [Thermoleophilaceae bacterium]|nr:MerR family transcriptional regulator [Thermoleophilaceae bacterium]